MFRYILLFATLAALLPGQTVILHENFNSVWSTINPPTGWRIHYTPPPQASNWHRAPDLGINPWPANTTPYAMIYSSPAKLVTDSFITPVFSCAGFATVILRCSTALQAGTGSYLAAIFGSTDGGVTWPHMVRQYPRSQHVPPQLESLNLAWAVDQPQVALAWVFVGNVGDFAYWAFDNVTVTGIVSQLDVGCKGIIVPRGLIDSGATVTPRVWVGNFGNVPAAFTVRMRIGPLYEQTRLVTNLLPGDSQQVSFPDWQAVQRGPQTVRCSTELNGDINPANNARSETALVVVNDVGVVLFDVPKDTADSGSVITPHARVRNFGTDPANFRVLLFVNNRCIDSQLVTGLGAGETAGVYFAPYSAWPRGQFLAKCSTSVGRDVNPNNDFQTNIVFGRILDVAVVRLLTPRGVLPESIQLVPMATFTNRGNTNARFTLYFRILRGSDTVYYDNIAHIWTRPGSIDTAWFLPWFSGGSARYQARCRAALPGDIRPHDNLDTAIVLVGPHDVGVVGIWEPLPHIPAGALSPRVRVANYGTANETFVTHFRVISDQGPVYEDSLRLNNFPAGQATDITFRRWTAPAGRYLVCCSTALVRDLVPENDVYRDSVSVDSIATGWMKLADMPAGAAGKNVKAGGALTVVKDTLIYAFKGGGKSEFYCYNTERGNWTTCCSIPFCAAGTKKRVKAGAALASVTAPDRDWRSRTSRVYAFKGGGTSEFWCYDVAANQWTELPPIPGLKKVKGGAALVWVPSRTALYALKGNGTYEFWCYDLAHDTWYQKPDIPAAPPPQRPKKVKEGAALALAVWDHDTLLYALKGNSTRELWTYSPARDTWLYRDSVPYAPGKKNKIKDGAGLVSNQRDRLYLTKGGKTSEFWEYSLAAPWSPWTRNADIGGTEGIKSGGALVHTDGIVYALKGNNTREFWRYLPPPRLALEESGQPLSVNRAQLTVTPNPFVHHTVIRLAGNRHPSPARLEIRSVTGRSIRCLNLAPQQTTVIWNGCDDQGLPVPAGIYIIRLTGESQPPTKVLLLR